jgi:CheY-like chemotaxis protein
MLPLGEIVVLTDTSAEEWPRSILIVDDSEDTRILLGYILEKYTLYFAADGQEAIEKYEQYLPDLVLMDIILPTLDGIAATEKILSLNPDAKIIGLTAAGSEKVDCILSSGAVECLEKPVNYDVLVETVKKWLD